jgi:glucan phosphoethanolaminetransferase (alkaline phosphatase superfamily)
MDLPISKNEPLIRSLVKIVVATLIVLLFAILFIFSFIQEKLKINNKNEILNGKG